jgi:hypothetical protein
MNRILAFLIIFIFSSLLYSQPYFQKVTSGLIVNDNTWSEGCAWADYDNDGDMDLVVSTFNDYCWPCYFPIQLYRNNGDGTFERVGSGPIANEVTAGFGCAWGDYDNDGRIDLFIATGFGLNNLLFHNEGNGNFTKVTNSVVTGDGGFSASGCWLDYDKDGWLDLFVLNQQNDFLYHNNGNGTFTKIISGAIINDGLFGRSCAVGDYDNDGYPDLIITTWGGPVRLYHNERNGTFSITNAVIPNINNYHDGVSFGDYDNDGWLDLFICSINSGNNILLHNNAGVYSQVFYVPSLESGPESFGCTWLDFDNDGWLDLFVTNNGNHNFLYRNNNGNGFTKLTNELISNEIVYGIGSSTSDINLDGKLEIFVANNGTSNSPSNNLLYQNVTPNPGKFIGIKLKGCNFNKSAIGARITVKAGGRTFTKEVSGGGGYHSQDMTFQHFGIGSASIVDSVIVKWTTGSVQKLANVQPNQYISISECTIGIISYSSELPERFELGQNYPNPFNPSTILKFSLPKNSDVTLKIYDNTGKEVQTLLSTNLQAGTYGVEYNAEGMSSGIYYYRLLAGSYAETKKMVLIK